MPKEWKKRLAETPPPAPEAKEAHPRETDLFAAEIGRAPEIDLHGLSVDEALKELERFIHHELMRGTDAVRIIHGKGEGKLEPAVRKWLTDQHALVPYFRGAVHKSYEQGAVVYAALERLKPPLA